jgi:two-component system, chemotaxis family, protein-glutamate methylesterase/glutaminase
MEQVFLLPTDYYACQKPTLYRTVLGSCVSVCLHNARRGIAAMNHFMLPTADKRTDDVGRYGDTATDRIIKTLMAIDRDPSHYRAQIFGGGAVLGVLGSGAHIGDRNIEIACSVVEAAGIPIENQDVGGTLGRRLDFDTGTGVAVCRAIKGVTEAEKKPGREISVLIVDDSETTRKVIRAGLEGVGGIKVVGEAENPFDARDLLLSKDPDVITLDIEMPKMDGLTFLRHLMKHFPKPVVVVSTMSKKGSIAAGTAQALGAVAVVDKAHLRLESGSAMLKHVLVPIITNAAKAGQAQPQKRAAQ